MTSRVNSSAPILVGSVAFCHGDAACARGGYSTGMRNTTPNNRRL